ncbi:Predicted PurR-regulated permease PerM [Lachnospiraceae bacterium XBB1006]|nr:Predicted PurR-regulated permease PerM [Lachnospiraceae bacterium XBB1006]
MAENRKVAEALKKREETTRTNWNIRPYLAMGLTAFIVLAASIVLYFFIERYNGASANIGQFMTILQPISIGVIFAYLLNPLVNRIEAGLDHLAITKGKPWIQKASRTIGIITAMLILVLFILLFIQILVPQLYETIEGLAITMPGQARETSKWVQDFLKKNEVLAKYADTIINEGTSYVEKWLRTDLLPQSKEIITQVTSGILVFAKAIMNFLIGLIICIYVLLEKDHFLGGFKKIIYSLFPAHTGNVIVRTARRTHSIFSGFIIGKIIDSIIIGVLCYIILAIVRMPYSLLVSCVVGVTNVIPFFGPYVGAIPSFLLILLESPTKAITFLIIILILQQFDGNILGPKILGQSTGLTSFWVIFAILVGSGMFGFLGMLFGVPVFAVIYYIFNEIVKARLRRKHLPEDSAAFLEVDLLDEDTRTLKYKKEDC